MPTQIPLAPAPAPWKVTWDGRQFQARQETGPHVTTPNRYHPEHVARSIAATLNATLGRR